MKNNRQAMILDIITKENVETQEQLLEHLRQRGVSSTQATISRDIKQLHLVKEPAGHGAYKYAVSNARAQLNVAFSTRASPAWNPPRTLWCSKRCPVWQAAPARLWTTWTSTACWARWQGRTPFLWS
mgnify:CR=1 FL=1